jgi:hypothetical protein
MNTPFYYIRVFIALIFILTFVIMLGASWSSWDTNPAHWTPECRTLVLVLWVLGIIISFFATDHLIDMCEVEDEEEEEEKFNDTPPSEGSSI